MNKILIADDRIKRQSQHLPNGEQGVEQISQLKHVSNNIGDDFDHFLGALKDGNFGELLDHDLWILHRSFLVENNLLNKIQQLAKVHGKHLILFSGGITQSSFSSTDHPFLSLNSKTLYSNDLIPFLEIFDAEEPGMLLSLVYGVNWKLSSLFKYRQVLLGVEYPGRRGQVREELEALLGIMDIEEVNRRINELILTS